MLYPENKILNIKNIPNKNHSHPSSVHSTLYNDPVPLDHRLSVSWNYLLLTGALDSLTIMTAKWFKQCPQKSVSKLFGVFLSKGALRQCFVRVKAFLFVAEYKCFQRSTRIKQNKTKLSVDDKRFKITVANLLMIILKGKDLISVYKNNAAGKKCGGFLGRLNKIKSSLKALDKISVNIVINFVFKEGWVLHLIYKNW